MTTTRPMNGKKNLPTSTAIISKWTFTSAWPFASLRENCDDIIKPHNTSQITAHTSRTVSTQVITHTAPYHSTPDYGKRRIERLFDKTGLALAFAGFRHSEAAFKTACWGSHWNLRSQRRSLITRFKKAL